MKTAILIAALIGSYLTGYHIGLQDRAMGARSRWQ